MQYEYRLCAVRRCWGIIFLFKYVNKYIYRVPLITSESEALSESLLYTF